MLIIDTTGLISKPGYFFPYYIGVYMLKGILINAFTKEVLSVDVQDGIDHMQKLINCRSFTSGEDIFNNALYVDDEGLLVEANNFFYISGHEQPYAGNGLIMGVDYNTGESTDITQLTIEDVRNRVSFLSAWDIQQRYSR